jgi:Spy/CpxP family protein refolding chaperone
MTASSQKLKIKDIPGITAEQQQKITAIKKDHDAQSLVAKEEKKSLESALKPLVIAPNPDMISINKKIDEIAVVYAKMKKIKADQVQQIRKILTPDQRKYYEENVLYPQKKKDKDKKTNDEDKEDDLEE